MLVLSLFPGVDLLGHGFELEWPEVCIVRGPDIIFGSLSDVRRFHPPSGHFAGIIGGPPCQCFSSLAHLVRANGHEPKFGNLIPEFERCVKEAMPDWFLMENVPAAPEPVVESYGVKSFLLDNSALLGEGGFGLEQRRVRRFSFGLRGREAPSLLRWIDLATFLLPDAASTTTQWTPDNSQEAKSRTRTVTKLGPNHLAGLAESTAHMRTKAVFGDGRPTRQEVRHQTDDDEPQPCCRRCRRATTPCPCGYCGKCCALCCKTCDFEKCKPASQEARQHIDDANEQLREITESLRCSCGHGPSAHMSDGFRACKVFGCGCRGYQQAENVSGLALPSAGAAQSGGRHRTTAVNAGHDDPNVSLTAARRTRRRQAVLSDPSAVPVAIGGSGKRKRTCIGGGTLTPGAELSRNGQRTKDRERNSRVSRFADACRLQGLPEDFLKDAPFTADGKLKAVANGVPIPMGCAIARAVWQALESTPCPP